MSPDKSVLGFDIGVFSTYPEVTVARSHLLTGINSNCSTFVYKLGVVQDMYTHYKQGVSTGVGFYDIVGIGVFGEYYFEESKPRNFYLQFSIMHMISMELGWHWDSERKHRPYVGVGVYIPLYFFFE